MEPAAALSIPHFDRLARLVIEDDLVFRAVVFEDAANVVHPRDQREEGQKDRQSNYAVDQAESEVPLQPTRDFLDLRRCYERHKLVQEDEEADREGDVQRHHPTRDLGGLPVRFLRRSLSGLFVLLVYGVHGRELQRLEPQLQSLTQRGQTTNAEPAPDLSTLRRSADRRLIRNHLAVRSPHRRAVAVRRAHHDTFDHGLTADQGVIAA